MNRTEIIQRVLDHTGHRNYLEIGVETGRNFFRVRAARKVAVDPHFKFSLRDKVKWSLKNPSNFLASYREVTSDRYFQEDEGFRPGVVFIDGLHTYGQALQDVYNALQRLEEGGVILMHDCNPPHEAAAYPAGSCEEAVAARPPGWTGEWCGDVWKAVCHLRAAHDDLEVFVLDCDYGVGVVTRGHPENRPDLAVDEIPRLTYRDLETDRDALLNLKPPEFLESFLGRFSGGRS